MPWKYIGLGLLIFQPNSSAYGLYYASRRIVCCIVYYLRTMQSQHQMSAVKIMSTRITVAYVCKQEDIIFITITCICNYISFTVIIY